MLEGYELGWKGRHCEVWLSKKALDQLERLKFNARDTAAADLIAKELAENGGDNLNEYKFKSEGKFASGSKVGGKINVWVIKAHQLRMYGGFITMSGRKFLCVEVAKKKQNKADQKQLKRVAKKIG